MIVRFVIQSTAGQGIVEWSGPDDGTGGKLTRVEAPEAIRPAILGTLQPGARAWFAPDLGGAFEGFDPSILRHVEEGLVSLASGRLAVLTARPFVVRSPA